MRGRAWCTQARVPIVLQLLHAVLLSLLVTLDDMTSITSGASTASLLCPMLERKSICVGTA